MSTANSFKSDIERYFNEVEPLPGAPAPPEGEEIPMIEVRGALRDMLRSFDPEEIPEEKSLIPGIKELARLLLRTEDFVMVKESISRILNVKYAEFLLEAKWRISVIWLGLEKSPMNRQKHVVQQL